MFLNVKGFNKIGSYRPNNADRLTFLPPTEEIDDGLDDRPINEMTFNVIISVVNPYIMLKDTSNGLVGNDRFEGFGIDIIDELSRLYGFKYNYIPWDSEYGSPPFDNKTNLWT